jgi:hypothetical protein
MARWIKDGKIIDEDFAYLCGGLVLGLSVYYNNKDKYVTLGNTDNSYVAHVAKIIKKLTNLNPTVEEYEYKSTLKGQEYETPRTNLAVNIPIREIDFFAKLITLKKNFRRLKKLVLNSDKEMQRRFLQAAMDAKASPAIYSKHDLDIYLYINKRQFPIISSALKVYGIFFIPSPKINPKFIYIKNQRDVDKIIDDIGFNSERLKRKIDDLTDGFYNLS